MVGELDGTVVAAGAAWSGASNRASWYLAHLGVAPQLHGRGTGEALVSHLVAQGRDAGYLLAALDVAASNPGTQALYERRGFSVTKERRSRLMNVQATVPDHLRMELRLADFPRLRP